MINTVFETAFINSLLWVSCSLLLFVGAVLSARLNNSFARLQVITKTVALAWFLAIGAVLLVHPDWAIKLLLILCVGFVAVSVSASLLAYSIGSHVSSHTHQDEE